MSAAQRQATSLPSIREALIARRDSDAASLENRIVKRIRRRAIVVRSALWGFLLIGAIATILWLASGTRDMHLIVIAVAALFIALLLSIVWTAAQHAAPLHWITGSYRDPPNNSLAEILGQLRSGTIEAVDPGGAIVDPSLFASHLAWLLFSRNEGDRMLVRSAGHRRYRDMLRIDAEQVSARAKGMPRASASGGADDHRNEQDAGDAQPRTENAASTNDPRKPRAALKSLWVLRLDISRVEMETRLAALDPPDRDPVTAGMVKLAMRNALGHLLDQPLTATPAGAVRAAADALNAEYGRVGLREKGQSSRWIETMLADPPAWLREGLRAHPGQLDLHLDR